MATIKLRESDEDLLPLLRRCSSSELDNLVGYITGKGGVSCQLKNLEIYKENFPNHSKYADEIAAEIQKFGGNTIFNILRKGKGALYSQIACDVASRLKIKTDKNADIEEIETKILLKVLELSWDKMSPEEKASFFKGIISETGNYEAGSDFPEQLIHGALIAGGTIITYRLSVAIASAIARITLERGITLAVETALARWASIFTGAIGLGITAAWTIFDVAGPAFRVTVPCVLHVAMLRQLYKLKDQGIDPDEPAGLLEGSKPKKTKKKNKKGESKC